MLFSKQVIEVNAVDEDSFSVHLLERSGGSSYLATPDSEVELVKKNQYVKVGPTEHYNWTVLTTSDFKLTETGHLLFRL